ncbi:hypothetical protein E2R23_12580 [Burkholderia pseudomallei]|nr:hypothetical protein EXY72_12570 [Burkholderia pseudomallei]QBL78514.1 hypothetical protein EYA82_12495 [Burkholderia pseudomallei]QBL85160.1 hypothetical protein EYA88_12375 [Burkholderia pseudomallei]QBP48990.1 hypothetical protein E2R28_12480 [Burkholderia pseudomallei]QBP55647.1 hypothetical protein E2R23_12580 [Burkholderia pseudomallei]
MAYDLLHPGTRRHHQPARRRLYGGMPSPVAADCTRCRAHAATGAMRAHARTGRPTRVPVCGPMRGSTHGPIRAPPREPPREPAPAARPSVTRRSAARAR